MITASDTIRLENGAGHLLRIASARANSLYEKLTGQSEITPPQYGALITLHQRGRMTLSDLAAAVHTDRSTMGEIVRRMSRRHLVELSPNGADGRSKTICIARTGEAALQKLTDGATGVQDVLLRPIPKSERATFMRHLTSIAFDPGFE